MDAQQKGLISLIRAAVTGSTEVISAEFSIKAALETAHEHNISSLLYYGAVKCGFDKQSEEMQSLFMSACAQLSVNEQQMYEFGRLFDEFENAEIDYMPLKGLLLKQLYPQPEMRAMGDGDILIRSSQLKKAEEIVSSVGFVFCQESDHESVWTKGRVMVELHKSLMSKEDKTFSLHFGDIWSMAQKADDNKRRYKMSDEDFYLFMFAHFVKHYAVSGIGIKHMVDLWIYADQKKDLDYCYIEEKLKKIDLFEFYTNITNTLNVWFDSTAPDELTSYITNVIFNSGEYGVVEEAELGRIVRNAKNFGSMKKMKTARFFKIVFLPYLTMCSKYPILKKAPLLLPVMWVVRAFDVIFLKTKRISEYFKNKENITDEKIQIHQQNLKRVGLDFNFKE